MTNTTTEKKVTKRDNFAAVRAIVDGVIINPADKARLLAFVDHEVELLDKKSGKTKETKTQAANNRIKTLLFAVLEEQEKAVTISELMEDERLKTYTEEDKDGIQTIKMSNQKLSAVMKMLVDAGKVTKTEDKKKSFFKLPEIEG